MRSDSSIRSICRLRAALLVTLAAGVLTATVPAASVAPAIGDADPIAARLVGHLAAETLGIDATLQVLRDVRLADALSGALGRGVAVRVIVPEARYRDAADGWHAWNVDRLHAAGVQVRHLRRAGPPAEGLLVLHGQGMVVLGAFGATAPGDAPPAAFAQFADRAWMYAWAVERFTRLWHNGAGHEETVAFRPQPAGAPQLVAPGDGADGAPAPVVLRWQPGPWAHRYDVYVGLSPDRLAPVVLDAALDPGRDAGAAVGAAIADPAADTTYYWRVVNRTLAGLEQDGPIWSFRTSATPLAVGTSGRAATPRLSESAEASLSAIVEPSVLETLIQRRPPQGGDSGRAAVPRSADDPDGPVPPPPPGAPAGPPPPAPPANPAPAAPATPDGGGAVDDDAAAGEAPVADTGVPAQEPAVDGYPGREPGAAWRQAALERIERIRKSDIELRVVDAEGRPIEGAEVRLEMTRHRFGFGSAVTAYDLTVDSDDGRRYRAMVERLFNRVVFENDLKWKQWEDSALAPPGARYNRQSTFGALHWLNERGIDVRGHYVVEGRVDGSGLRHLGELDDEALRAAVLAHAEEIVTAVGTRVKEWDVVNHPIGWGGRTLVDRLGHDFYDLVFARVAQWMAGVWRFINEGGVLPVGGSNRDRYHALIERLLARGVPIEGIGFMGHFFAEQDLPAMAELLDTFDRYAVFGLPLQITEFDVRYGTQGERLVLTPEQEQLQADFTRDFLIAAFSHPAVEGVVMWGFWERRHWFPSAALYREDWTAKPNGRSWEDLVFGAWWTSERGATNEEGQYRNRGFHGEYRVDVEYAGRGVSCRLTLGPAGVAGDIQIAGEAPLAAAGGPIPACLR